MFIPGTYTLLQADEYTPHGLFLVDPKNPEKRILLPGIELNPNEEIQIGSTRLYFVYLDSQNRLTVTLKNPKIVLHQFAYLSIVSVTPFGAFADWGMPKDLFIPFKEISPDVAVGYKYLIFLYHDTETGRLVGSAKIDNIVDNTNLDLKEEQEVDILVWKETDLGFKVIVNHQFEGLIFHNDIFTDLSVGDYKKAYVKQIREDKKLDISLQKTGKTKRDSDAQVIMNLLLKSNGYLEMSDKTDPQQIYDITGMSKKAFKRAVGQLYKEGKVSMLPKAIQIINED